MTRWQIDFRLKFAASVRTRRLGTAYFVLLVFTLLHSIAFAQETKAQINVITTPLTKASAIRILSPERAVSGIPVRVRGVVTLIDPGRTVFLQDSSGGTFIKIGKPVPEGIVPGDEIEVEGVTYPGLYVPGIEPERVQILGKGRIPTALSVGMEDLSSGHHNYEWVQVRGIIRSVEASSDRTILLLAIGSGRLEVHALGEIEARHLVDASVVVTGLAAGFINDKRQLVAPHLRIRDLSDIAIEETAPSDPFSQLPVSAAHLLRFSPEQRPGHRVKVVGIVTLQEPGRALFLRDGEQGLYVATTQPTVVHPGDTVEVLGFPEMGQFSAQLQNATFRIISSGLPPPPIHTDEREILRGRRDGDLVSVEAHVVRALAGQGEGILLMQTGETLFRARGTFPISETDPIRSGSILRLTGVCQVAEAQNQAIGFRANPRAFEILLRSPQDIELIRSAPWWNAQRLAAAVALLLIATTAAIAWAALLRHQVRRQTALLRDKMETEILLEERQRLAREFHDTLEQELIGLSLRLDALATRVSEPKPCELLSGARKLLQRLQSEARSLVWDLREHASVRGDFGAAIRQVTKSVGDDVQIEVKVTGSTVPLPEVVEHHLIRIAQEAVTNAVKHGHASTIQIYLQTGADEVKLTVNDNGGGFDPTNESVSRPGHFGLIGMKERARKMGGQLRITSSPCEGTIVEFAYPTDRTVKPALPTYSTVG